MLLLSSIIDLITSFRNEVQIFSCKQLFLLWYFWSRFTIYLINEYILIQGVSSYNVKCWEVLGKMQEVWIFVFEFYCILSEILFIPMENNMYNLMKCYNSFYSVRNIFSGQVWFISTHSICHFMVPAFTPILYGIFSVNETFHTEWYWNRGVMRKTNYFYTDLIIVCKYKWNLRKDWVEKMK